MALAWSSSAMLSLSLLSPPEKLAWKRFEPATKASKPGHLNSRIQVMCGSTLAVAVSTTKSTSVSGSSESILLNDLRGSSSGLDILGNVLESFDTISTQGQEITEKNDSQQLKIALPLRNDEHLYEFDKYPKDDLSGFSSCLAPFVEQLQECFSPSTGPQYLMQSVCANPTIPKETACENQEIASTAAVMDVVALAKAAVEAARDVAALVEAQALQEGKGNGQKSLVYVPDPLRPSSAMKDNDNNIEKLVDSKFFEVNLYKGQFLQLDEQHSQSATSSRSPLETVNVMVRSNRQMERKAKRERVSQKVEESCFVSPSHVHQKGKKPLIATYGPKDSIPSVLQVPDHGRLLSAEEEVELSQKVKGLLQLEKVKECLQKQLGREPTSVEWAKAVGIDKNSLKSRLKTGQRCKDRMIKSNLRLVVSVAKHYNGLGISLPDLVQAGNMGLVKGVEKFDPKRGFKFSTCAHWWIREAVTRHLSQNSKIVQRPVYYAQLMSRIKKARDLFYQEHRRDPSIEELAEVVGVSVTRLRKVFRTSRTPKSFEQGAGKDQETCLAEILGDTDDGDPESTIMKRSLEQDVVNLLRKLQPKEREVIRLRHGLDGGKSRTLEEVGHTLKITKERTRQLELRAMRKLKLPDKTKTLRNHLNFVG